MVLSPASSLSSLSGPGTPAPSGPPGASVEVIAPPDSDDNVFQYSIEGAKSTADAFKKMRKLQRALYAADGSPSSASQSFSGFSQYQTEEAPLRNALPSTLTEFREHPALVVSLTAPRTDVLEDALSGFKSLVARESTQNKAMQQTAAPSKPKRYLRTYQTQGGIACTSVTPLTDTEEGVSLQTLAASFPFVDHSRREELCRCHVDHKERLCEKSHADANSNTVDFGTSDPSKNDSTMGQPQQLPATTTEEQQREAVLRTYLAERAYHRRLTPEVFRCRMPEFSWRAERIRFLNTRKESYWQSNAVRPEWMYVWDQFKRDVPRETLLVENTVYRDPEEAIAAIISFLENAYARGLAAQEARQQDLKRERARPERGGSFFSRLRDVGNTTLKSVAIQAQDTLPAFMATPLLEIVGLDPQALRDTVHYDHDSLRRQAAIYAAARETALAAQQSFMGFPYQLLCEQLGTTRLAQALERFFLAEREAASSGEEAQEERPVPPTPTPPPQDPASATVIPGSPMHPFTVFLENPFSQEAMTPRGDPTEANGTGTESPSPDKGVPTHTRNTVAAERHRQRRWERAARTLPLLVGEPRLAEFQQFLEVIRRRVQTHDHENPQFSEVESTFFRDAVNGSAFLIPEESEQHPSSAEEEVLGATRGMRVHMYYHTQRNAPVVGVDKLFRLFVEPGLCDAAALGCDKLSGSTTDQSVLLHVHIELGMFTSEEVEVRWQWFNI